MKEGNTGLYNKAAAALIYLDRLDHIGEDKLYLDHNLIDITVTSPDENGSITVTGEYSDDNESVLWVMSEIVGCHDRFLREKAEIVATDEEGINSYRLPDTNEILTPNVNASALALERAMRLIETACRLDGPKSGRNVEFAAAIQQVSNLKESFE